MLSNPRALSAAEAADSVMPRTAGMLPVAAAGRAPAGGTARELDSPPGAEAADLGPWSEPPDRGRSAARSAMAADADRTTRTARPAATQARRRRRGGRSPLSPGAGP